MKKIYTYLFALIAVVSVSCEKTGMGSSTDVGLVPEGGYIRFSTKVSTKAPLLTNLRENSFGILGYEYNYSTNWESARALAKPTVFYDEKIVCDEDGVCTYDPLKPWNLTKKYAFFAYYPQPGNNGITISSESKTDTPTISYALPLSDNPVLPEKMCDLMTAYAVNETAGGGTVGLTFQHKLFCIDVLAQNYNDTQESISKLTLTIDNLKYQGITLPLKNDEGTTVVYDEIEDNNNGYQFRLIGDSDDTVTVNKADGQVNMSEDKIMLIPQNEGIKGTIAITFEGDNNAQVYAFDFTKEMKEGRKYNLIIKFTGNTIVIANAEAESWDSWNVEHEFE